MVTHNGLHGTWSEDQASAMFIIFTGVAGAGKTTVGKLLAKELSWRFYEGDDFHPAANVEKLRRGEPLTDDDRRPWLDTLRDVIQAALERGENGVLACSALKRSYRARLRVSERVIFVHLAAGPDVIQRRLERREGHFMNPSLIESQFATLETPQAALSLDASLPPDVLVQQVRQALSI
ncbi:MAG: gluconokinase [Candidatus Binatia bacterium]